MWTNKDIKRMFAEMGLSSEEDKARLLRLAEPPQELPRQRTLTFIIATNTTLLQEFNEGEEHGQLE